ncbi:hypothetical protein V8G54_034603 [Vigna mungo]|uniref:Uncharacterized protein n=1 Tax=Vigna mungo TaxID=3915 RepID=A0AAQ3RKZ8_VIGMU
MPQTLSVSSSPNRARTISKLLVACPRHRPRDPPLTASFPSPEGHINLHTSWPCHPHCRFIAALARRKSTSEKRVCLDMGGDEHMNEELELRDSLDKEKKLEDGLKLNVVTEEVREGVLAENGFLSLEDGSPKRSTEIVGTYDTNLNAIGLNDLLIQEEKGKNRWGRVYERKNTRKGDVAH